MTMTVSFGLEAWKQLRGGRRVPPFYHRRNMPDDDDRQNLFWRYFVGGLNSASNGFFKRAAPDQDRKREDQPRNHNPPIRNGAGYSQASGQPGAGRRRQTMNARSAGGSNNDAGAEKADTGQNAL